MITALSYYAFWHNVSNGHIRLAYRLPEHFWSELYALPHRAPYNTARRGCVPGNILREKHRTHAFNNRCFLSLSLSFTMALLNDRFEKPETVEEWERDEERERVRNEPTSLKILFYLNGEDI